MPQIANIQPNSAQLYPNALQTDEKMTKIDHQTELSVIRFVQRLGIRPNLTGYQLLISSIKLALNDPDLLNSMTRELYPMVAALHGCAVRTVERNIRKAIESAYEYDPERIRSVFYFKVKKPYISEVVSLAVELIRYENAMNSNDLPQINEKQYPFSS